jgi:DNA-binding NarL/FixJ family response regulator
MSVTIESTAGFAADDPLTRLYRGFAAIAGERAAIWLLLDLVEAALRAGRVSDATAAQAWTDRAAAQLRATKLARPRGERCASGALTLRELEIAEFAAAGLSNKQIGRRLFLSNRTLDAHLYRVFPKLGITSRGAAGRERGTFPRTRPTGASRVYGADGRGGPAVHDDGPAWG